MEKHHQKQLSNTQIEEFLYGIDFFASIDKKAIQLFSQLLTITHIKGGETLLQEGEQGDCLYFLMHGRLRAYYSYGTANEIVIAEIGAGEIVGEIAMFTEEARTATVIAIRDCILLRLDKVTFDDFNREHPEIAMQIAKTCIKRLSLSLKDPYKQKKSSAIKTIVLLPLSTDVRIQQFFSLLKNRLVKNYKTLYVSGSTYKESANSHIWFTEQEDLHQFVVYEAGPTQSAWTDLCIRQADCIYLVGLNENQNGDGYGRNSFLMKQNIHCRISLILLHEKTSSPDNTHLWLDSLHINDYYHIRYQDEVHLDRIARIITDNSIALVLSGGGARAFAHIGLFKALEELKIPVDIVAGSSMGAVASALIGQGLNANEISNAALEFSKRATKFSWVFPYSSIIDDKVVTTYLQEIFSLKARIENMWLRYFCVSTNLSDNQEVVHTDGLLWLAVRASVSLPGIYPPITDGSDKILVDGAVINNLPVDEMSKLFHPGKIIASSLAGSHEELKILTQEKPTVWQVLRNRLNPLVPHMRVSYLPDIIFSSIILHSSLHQQIMERQADLCIIHDVSEFEHMDFSEYEKIIEKGYETAMQQLPKLLI